MRPADLTPVARDVMKGPASAGLMFFSMLAGYMVSALPWSGKWLLSRPDVLLIVLIFWTVHEPRSIGQGIAFLMGLLMDVGDSMLLGATFVADSPICRIGLCIRSAANNDIPQLGNSNG